MICGAEGVHRDVIDGVRRDVITVSCILPAGHAGEHRNPHRNAAWTDKGPIIDLMGRPWLLGTLPSRPRTRRR